MTEKTLDWLNHNRFTAYPFVNNADLISGGTRVPDCILLDCLVVDTRHVSPHKLVFTEFKVTAENTRIEFKYVGKDASTDYTFTLSAGTDDNLEHLVVNDSFLYMKFVFSSHDYILEHVGEGTWTFSGQVLPSKVVSVPASGVAGLQTNGSANVEGYEAQNTAVGDVHLVDGYRTQPVIQNGKVLVKVGTHYGEDPCHYVDEELPGDPKVSCDDLLLFFCGQNATSADNGNVTITGGSGVNVKQGGVYTAKTDIIDTYGDVGVHVGESIPCIEITATSELLRLYRPSKNSPDDSSESSA